MRSKILEVKNISKSFPGVHALSNVDFDLFEDEVHAVIGENGAGKSTLMKILAGSLKIDEGKIYIDGKSVRFDNPMESIKNGISAVYQELSLFQNMTVAENIFVARQPVTALNLIRFKALKKKADELLKKLGLDIDPGKLVSNLSAAERQEVEIVRALSYDSKVLILDEPTSSLSLDEINKLFNLLRKLKSNGVGTIYISHHLNEIFTICDRATILRNGKKICTKDIKDTNEKELVELMIGGKINEYFKIESKKEIKEETILEIKNLNRKGVFKDINFKLYKGEILGFYGLVGSGRTKVARAIFGVDPVDEGKIFMEGKEIKLNNPRESIFNSIGFVSEDRKTMGLFLSMGVKANIVAPSLKKYVNKMGLLNESKMTNVAKKYVKDLGIVTSSLDKEVRFLSGGNQQKVLIAPWLATDSKILIINEPTRGIDVGAKGEIHFLLDYLANQGVGIIMISSELPEILRISNRIAVMHKGQIVIIIENDKTNPKEMEKLLMMHASGLYTNIKASL